MKHFKYLSYIIRHKWFVMLAGTKIHGCSWYRLLVHDLSKFLPSEWFPYVNYFYGEEGNFKYVKDAFDMAWLKHQHRNLHHWQYWILLQDDGTKKLLDMPSRYVKEMVADWAGAGKAITGEWEVASWYLKNADKIEITRDTRREVEIILVDTFGMISNYSATVEEI